MTYTIADVAGAHQRIREKRSALKSAFDAEDEALKAEQTALRVHLLVMLQATGGTSVNTPSGTVYRRTVVKAAAADWSAIWAWQKEHDAPDLVQKRLNTSFITEFMEANNDEIPPGINLHTEFDVSIRKN